MLLSNRILTPPTMLQTAPCGARFKRELIYPEHNIHSAFLDLHSLDQGPNNITFAVPVGLIQPILDPRGEVFQSTDNQMQFGLQLGLIRELSRLLLQFLYAFSQPLDPRFKLLFINQTLAITIDDSRRPLPQLIQLRLDPGKIVVLSLCLRLKTTTILPPSAYFLSHTGVRQTVTISLYG